MSSTQLVASQELYSVIKERDQALAELEHGRAGVSVTIPCFEQSQYLQEALDSLAKQTVEPVEVIVVDDGSSVEEGARIAELCSIYRARYVRVTNRHLAAARNTGLMLAKGKWFLPLDADDWLDPSYIQKTLYEGEMSGADVVLTGIEEFGPQRHGIYQPGFDRPWQDVTPELLLSDYNRLFYCSLFRTKMLRECGGYNTLMVHGHEDWDLWIDLLRRQVKFSAVLEPLFCYRTSNPNSMLRDADQNWRQANMAEMARHHGV